MGHRQEGRGRLGGVCHVMGGARLLPTAAVGWVGGAEAVRERGAEGCAGGGRALSVSQFRWQPGRAALRRSLVASVQEAVGRGFFAPGDDVRRNSAARLACGRGGRGALRRCVRPDSAFPQK